MQMSKSSFLIAATIALSLCVSACTPVREQGTSYINDLVKALNAADAWVDLLDQGKIEASYSGTAPTLQQKATLAQWEKDLGVVHEKFGKVTSRKFQAVQAATILPPSNIPGKYFVVVYDARFTTGKKASQVVSMMWNAGKKAWLVAGYYVR